MKTADDGRMPGAIDGRAAVRQTIAVAWGTWARSAAVVAAITAVFLVVVLVAMGVLSDLARLQADSVVQNGQVTLRGIVTLVLQVAVPTLVIGLMLTALIMAALVSLADDQLAGSRSTLGSAFARGLRRAPVAFGAMALAVGGVLLAIAVTPLLMIVGALGLLLTPLARLVARRSTRLGWWPSARALALLIVPLAPALVLAARWALVLPAASLELRGPRQALARSRSLMAGRSVQAVPLLVLGVAAYLLAQLVVVQAGALAGLDDLAVALRLAVQLVVIAVPVAMVVVVFRQLAGPTDDHLIVPTPAPRVPTRTLAVTMLLAVSLTAGVLVISQVVRAEPAAAEGSVAFTVNSLGDEPDATPGDAQCLTAGGVCSLRAAIEETNAGPATDLQIMLALTGTIRLASALEITTDFTLDGGATGLSLSGRPCDGCEPETALLRFTNAATTFNLRNLTLDGGLASPDGGGAIETVATGALQNVTLTQNRSDSAPGGAIAVLGGALEIENATFANNLAPSGADLAVLHGSASVSQSTFVDASGSAVHSEEVGQLTIYKSILTGQDDVVCSGAQLNGGLNLSRDPACQSETRARGLQPLADNGGPVFTVGLSSESNAVDAGSQESCAATDARGVARPQGPACDIGAFELEIPTGPTFTVDDLGDATDADLGDGLCHTATGACTLRAAAGELNTLNGDPARIQFGLPGTVAVASPIALAAQMVVTGNGHQVVLDGGGQNRILETLTPGVAIQLDRLTLANGFTDEPEGGAALRSTGDVTTESMTFRNNVSTAAPGGAVAVGGDRVGLTNATFWENSGVGGSDVWQHSWGQAMLTNVTLARGASGSLQSDLGEMYLFNSIVVPAAGAPCAGTGSYVAMQVLNPLGDDQCPQSIFIEDDAEIGLGTLGQRGGPVPTINITAASAAIDRVFPSSGTCPATDARGVVRDPQTCDVGSFELASVPNATVVVTADPPSPAQGQAVSLTATVTSSDQTWTPGGTVTFTNGDGPLGSASVGATGEAVLGDVVLPVGTHTVSAAFAATAELGVGFGTVEITVGKAATTTSLGVAPTPSVAGGRVTLTASVHVVAPGVGPATGLVRFFDGATDLGTGTLTAEGLATLDTTGLAAETHQLTAQYEGDGQRASSASEAVSHVVGVAGATVALTASTPTSRYGQTVTFTAALTAVVGSDVPTGNVAFTLDGIAWDTVAIDGTGKAAVSMAVGDAGSYELVATYAGDPRVGPGVSNRLTHEVIAADTTLSLTAPAATSNVGETLTLTALVEPVAPGAGAVTGDVVISQDGQELHRAAPDGTGRVTATITDLDSGDHTFTATYAGSTNHNGSTAPQLDHTVTRWASATQLSVAPNPVYGQGIDVTVTVSSPDGGPVPTGAVSVDIDGSPHWLPLDGLTGVATGRVPVTTAGSVSVSAEYFGDAAHFGSSTAAQPVTVGVAPTSTALTVDSTSALGQRVVLQAVVSVTDQTTVADGTVTFFDGTTELGSAAVGTDGTAEFSTDDLTLGGHQLSASFAGADFAASTSAVVGHNVVSAATSTTVTRTPETSVVGQAVTFMATVVNAQGSTVPTGTVVWTIGAFELGRTAVSPLGTATFTTSDLTVGSSLVTASFIGSGGHTDSQAEVEHTVARAATTVVFAADVTRPVTGQMVTYTATVSVVAPGVATPTGAVTFDGLSEVAVPLDANGVATLTRPAPAGQTAPQTFTARYSGDDDTESANGQLIQTTDLAAVSVVVTPPTTTVTQGDPVTLQVALGPVAPSTTVPTGGALTVRRNGVTISTVPATGAQTTITLDTPFGLAVGIHQLTVEWVAGGGYQTSVSAPASVTVAPKVPTLTVTSATNPSPLGQPVTIDVLITGATPGAAPTGTISLYDGTTLVGTGTVTALPTGLGARLTATLAVGARLLTAAYEPNTVNYRPATSAVFTQVINPIPTTATFVDPDPMRPGQTTTWRVIIRNNGPQAGTPAAQRPTGSVSFTMNGAPLATVPVTNGPVAGWSQASVTSPPLDGGVYEVVATYGANGNFGGSTATLTQVVGRAAVRVELTPFASTTEWGTAVSFTAKVVPPPGGGLRAPTGTITIQSDGGTGTSCTVPAAGGTCALEWADPGFPTVTASFPGDTTYEAATSDPFKLAVTKRTPSITGSVSEQSPATGTPVTMEWAVTGPASGVVSAGLGSATCPTTLVGTCTHTPTVAEASQIFIAGVTYAGDTHWNPARWAGNVMPVGCFAVRLAVEFDEGGTLTTDTKPNCGNGTGYLQDTWITVTATPAASGDPSFSWYLTSLMPGGGAYPEQTFRIGRGGDATDFVVARFAKRFNCATVTLNTELRGNDVRGSLRPMTDPDCPTGINGQPAPKAWTTGGGSYQTQVKLGSTVETYVAIMTEETEVYGYYQGRGQPLTQNADLSFVVRGDVSLTAVVGPMCYGVEAEAVGGGTASITSKPTCANPRTGVTGWTKGRTVEVLAVPSEDRQFLEGWANGGTNQVDELCEACADGGYPRNRYRTSFVVEPAPNTRVVKALFGSCYRVDVEVQQVTAAGKVTYARPPDCPGRPDSTWYIGGKTLGLHAEMAYGNGTFSKWNVGDADEFDDWRNVTVSEDVLFRPGFRSFGECPKVTVRAEQPEWSLVSTNGGQGDLICRNGGLADGPAAELTGTRHLNAPIEMTATAQQGNPELGWVVAFGGKRYTAYGSTLTANPQYEFTAVSVPCVGVKTMVKLTDPTGRSTVSDQEAGDFLRVRPAPNCPYMDNAWTVGSTIEVGTFAEPAGYEFLGWSERASGTDDIVTLELDGTEPTVPVLAEYQVHCYQMTLTHDAKDVTADPAGGNCPGYDAAEQRYIGGTLVELQGRVPGGKVWQGWVGDVEKTGKVMPAFLVMDADKTAGHRWRSKDAGEQIVDGLEFFGGQVAIGMKKVTGVAAIFLVEFLNNQPPFNILLYVATAAMAMETILQAAGVPESITKYFGYVHQTIGMLTLSLTCYGMWSFAGGGTKGAAHLGGKLGGLGADYSVNAAENAENLQKLEDGRTFMAPSTGDFRAVTTIEETTGALHKAKLGWARAKPLRSGGAAAVGVALTAYSIYQDGPGVGWDSSAEEAWTDWDAYTDCLKKGIPAYIGVPDGDQPPPRTGSDREALPLGTELPSEAFEPGAP